MTSPMLPYLRCGAAQNTDALQFLGTAVVSSTEKCFLLNHVRSSLLSLFDDLYQSPTLVLGQRASLHNLNGVAYAALVVLVMSLQLVGSLDNLLIKRMLYAVRDSNDNRLVHLVRNDLADSCLAESSISSFVVTSLTPFPSADAHGE